MAHLLVQPCTWHSNSVRSLSSAQWMEPSFSSSSSGGVTVADDPNEMCPNALWMCYAATALAAPPSARPLAHSEREGGRELERERERETLRARDIERRCRFWAKQETGSPPSLSGVAVVALMAVVTVWEEGEVA